ncbi:MAG: NAD(P)-dependent oxidoreductase [Erysipelotrichaceae bacterium]
MKIGWIGTGVMGHFMAMHLQQAGHDVRVYNRSIEKALPLKQFAILVCDSIAECVSDVEAVFTMVAFPSDVEAIYTGEDGIFTHAKKNALLIDMTTSSPILAKTLYQKGKAFKVLDAPVSGGESGARNATLSIMVGGDYDNYQQAYPLLESLATSIHYIGEAGCGQHCKAANQIAVAGSVAGMSEAIHYARCVNIDPNIILAAIQKGAAGSWQLDHNAPLVLENDFAPGFYIKHFIKDMKIVQEVMKSKNQDLKMLDCILEMYQSLAQHGLENEGTQALIKYYENINK